MDAYEIIKSAIKTVFASKLRTFLTMLGIVIGIGSVIAINSIGNGSTAQVEEQLFSEMSPTQITLELRSSSPRQLVSSDSLAMEDYEYLRDTLEGYEAISPLYSSSATFSYLDSTESKTLTISGVASDYEIISNVNILYGRYITEEEVEDASKVVVITDTLAEKYFGYCDESLIGEEFSVKTWKGKQKLTIVGISENKNAELIAMYGDEFPETVIMPIKTTLRMFNSKVISSIVLTASDKNNVTALTNLVDETIHEYRGTTDKYKATNLLEVLDSINQVTATMTLLISGIAGISLIVAGVGIMNIMLVTVTERTREIGIRKSIGAKNFDILVQFMVEAVIITFIGGAVGILAGWGLGILFGKILGIKSVLSTTSVIYSLLISSVIGLTFGIYPARKASLLDPIEALTKI